MRLALVGTDSSVQPAVDLLTVEFSADKDVVLLERAEIDRIQREQEVSATGKDWLKLGQVLSADGLLLLENFRERTNLFLAMRLVAVKPGVILTSARFDWPVESLSTWARELKEQSKAQLPKLNVGRAEAIPLSLVNLRSALQSAEGRELERELTFLAIERLSREKQLFMLERRQMQRLSVEKEWNAIDDAPFWSGSYLLEGVIDRDGYSADELTLDARLSSPDGGKPIEIRCTASRTNLAQVVEAAAMRVIEALKLKPEARPWHSAEEAEQFFLDATWGMRWKVFPQAQAGSEASWALGKRTPEVASLRLRSYSESCLHRAPIGSLNTDCVTIFAVPDASKLEPITRALELFAQGTDVFPAKAADVEWLKLGHRALRTAAGILEGFYYAAEMRVGNERALERLRDASRKAAGLLTQGAGTNSLALDRWGDCLDFSWLKWNEGGVWCEHPADALPMMRETLAGGFHPAVMPRLIGWNREGRKAVPRLLKQFIVDVCAATNVNLRLEGRYLALLGAPSAEPLRWQQSERELLAAIWNDRDWVLRSVRNVSLVQRVEESLRVKHGYENPTERLVDEEFDDLRHRLRREYLTTANTYDSLLFQNLFGPGLCPPPTPAEAEELLPLVERFAGRATEKAYVSNSIVVSFRIAAGLGVVRAEAPKPAGAPVLASVMGRFIPWRLAREGIEPDRTVKFSLGQIHNGRLWFEARYYGPRGAFGDYQTAFVEVDPSRGVTQEILFPAARGFPDAFMVSEEELLTSVVDKVECYNFRERKWHTLPIAVGGAAEFLQLPGRRFITTKESLLELGHDLRSAEVVASSRRQPPKHELDSLWGGRRGLVAGVHGKLGLIATNCVWLYDPSSGVLTNSPNFPVSGAPYALAGFTWGDGCLISMTGQSMMPRHLLALSDSATQFDSMLQQRGEVQGRRIGPGLAKQLPPPKWDWPEEFPFEQALLTIEARALWALNPRKFSNDTIPREPEEPVSFADDRDATLLRFEPDLRPPLPLRVRFEPNRQKINPFLAKEAGFAQPGWGRPNLHTWLSTPQGLVLAVPNALGHWLISQSDLQTSLEAQRKSLGARARSEVTSSNLPAALPLGLTVTNHALIRP